MSKVNFLNDAQLNEILANPAHEIVIVDVRNPGEHAVEHIPGSVNVPVDELLAADKNQFKDKAIMFHCKGGVRTRANEYLLEAFASQVTYCMEGGIEQWKALGKPVKN